MIAPSTVQSSDSLDLILCYYVNPSSDLQVAYLSASSTALFERLVFPQQRLLFEAPLSATLEIRTCSSLGVVTVGAFPCLRLQVNQRNGFPADSLAHIFDPSTQTHLGAE